MRFKEGDAVEVLCSEDAWFPAKVVSVDQHKFVVRFDHRQHKAERVPAEDVRPCPPPIGKKVRWALGDVAEVFDSNSWRAAKVVKVLHDNRFVVKVYSSILLKEFQGSSLRVRLTWQNDQWIRKDSVKKQNNSKDAYGNEGACQVVYNCSQNGKKVAGGFPPVEDVKRTPASIETSGIDAVEGSVKRSRKILEREEFQLPERGPRKKVHASVPRMVMDKKCLHSSTQQNIDKYSMKKPDIVSRGTHTMHPLAVPLQAIEERNECSIASCGSNYVLEGAYQDSNVSSRALAGRHFNDASSSCPSEPKKIGFDHGEEKFATNVHKLELQAYRSTVQAFYASGPLSWEQESLLTNLRLSLNISNEEHLLQLKNLLSAPVL